MRVELVHGCRDGEKIEISPNLPIIHLTGRPAGAPQKWPPVDIANLPTVIYKQDILNPSDYVFDGYL